MNYVPTPVAVPFGNILIVTLSLYSLDGCFAVAGVKTVVKRQDFSIKQGSIVLNSTAYSLKLNLKKK
jgi:hypothetical protein